MDKIYDDLISLCSQCDGFFYKDVVLDSINYRIFNYRLCSYEQFHKYPSALNCRGIMFNITDSNNIQLVSFPPEKFFNYEEGDGANVHQLGKFYLQMEKLDGSLISTFLHSINSNEQVLRLKSKASVTSDQATQAMNHLQGQYRDEIDKLVRLNYTVNFEYTSPSNQIVLYYPEDQLRVLSIRSHRTGETFLGDKLISFLQENHFSTIIQNIVSFKLFSESVNQQETVENIRKETEGEGYVIQIIRSDQKSYLVKVKTEKYLLLHHTLFNRSSPAHINQCVIYEQTDDLRSLFVNNSQMLQKIKEAEENIRPIYNQMIKSIQEFYEKNKHFSRKDYALKVQNTLEMKVFMPLIMNLYTGKEADYQKFATTHMKVLFGFNDQEQTSSITTNTDE